MAYLSHFRGFLRARACGRFFPRRSSGGPADVLQTFCSLSAVFLRRPRGGSAAPYPI